MAKSVIIFSGYNQRAVVACLRTLEACGVPYGVIAVSTDDHILLTEYKHRVVATRHQRTLDINDIGGAVHSALTALQTEECILAPSTEALNRFLLAQRARLQELGCTVPLVHEDVYQQVSDKYAFGELCAQHGITVPTEYASLKQAHLPCVAKPKVYMNREGKTPSPVLLHDQTDLRAFQEEYRVEDFCFQEFVDGDSLYLLYHFYGDGSVAKLSQINYVQQPGGKSMVAASTTDLHTSPESHEYESLFRSLKFRGLVMVEVRKTSQSCYMIEANPRFWGPSQLFVDAGVNLFESWLYDVGMLAEKPVFTQTQATNYFWYGGIIEALKSGNPLAFHAYTRQQLAADLATWLQSDIYNRPDTRELFVKETGL